MNQLDKIMQQLFGENCNYKLLREYPVLHNGWAMDNEMWIVEIDSTQYVITTSHGSPYIMGLDEAVSKKDEYYAALTGMRAAVFALTSKK
jgi:hypothetical protein